MNRAPQTCSPDDRVEDARAFLATYPMLPVVDDAGRPVGVVSRSDLLKPARRRFILVDHNERGQSLPGLEEAEVLAIVDHHRVADVATTSPIVFRAEPVGCTCTIIAGLYQEARLEIPRPVAGAMLAAIVSDTVLFRSPTATSRDREVAAMLESRCGASADDLADALFERSSDLANRSVRDLLEADFKEFAVGGKRFGIGSVDVTNLGALDALVDELRRTMDVMRHERGFAALLFLIVDVIHARSRIYVSGHERAAANALGLALRDGWYVNVDRVVSRKKDVVPVLGAVAQDT
jgi:manganese-dependent inorganic pyrophosphatase